MAELKAPIGVVSIGTKISIDDVTIPGMTKVPSLGGSAEKIETTTLDDSVKRSVNGVKDFGDLEFEVLYSSEVYEAVKAKDDKKEHKILVTLPDGRKINFSGTVTPNLNGAEVNNVIYFTIQVGLTSDVVSTAPVGV